MLIAFAQGAVVMVTASFLVRLFRSATNWSKMSAVALSYVGWVTFTIGGYAWLGGEGGLMDGFGLVLFLCFTAGLSSLVLLIAWTLEKPPKPQR